MVRDTAKQRMCRCRSSLSRTVVRTRNHRLCYRKWEGKLIFGNDNTRNNGIINQINHFTMSDIELLWRKIIYLNLHIYCFTLYQYLTNNCSLQPDTASFNCHLDVPLNEKMYLLRLCWIKALKRDGYKGRGADTKDDQWQRILPHNKTKEAKVYPAVTSSPWQ